MILASSAHLLDDAVVADYLASSGVERVTNNQVKGACAVHETRKNWKKKKYNYLVTSQSVVLTGPAVHLQSILDALFMKTEGQRGFTGCRATFSVGLKAGSHMIILLQAPPHWTVRWPGIFPWLCVLSQMLDLDGAMQWLPNLVGHLSCVKNNVFETFIKMFTFIWKTNNSMV